MTIVFLFARFFLGALLAYQGVRFLNPYARHASIADARRAGVKASYPAFISAGLMMLIGGPCIVLGVGAGVGVIATVTSLILSALAANQLWRVSLNLALAGGAGLLLLVPRPWPYSFIS